LRWWNDVVGDSDGYGGDGSVGGEVKCACGYGGGVAPGQTLQGLISKFIQFHSRTLSSFSHTFSSPTRHWPYFSISIKIESSLFHLPCRLLGFFQTPLQITRTHTSFLPEGKAQHQYVGVFVSIW